MGDARTLAAAALKFAICAVDRRLGDSLRGPISEWPGAIIPRVGDSLTAREMTRQFESATDRVAEELSLIQSSAATDISLFVYLQCLAGIEAVLGAKSWHRITDLDPAEIVPSDLHRRLLPEVEREWAKDEIAEHSADYGRAALTLCCYAVIAWARITPASETAAAWEALLSSTRIVDASRTMLLEVRRAGAIGNAGMMRVMGVQRRDLSSALGRMELFGLPVEWRFRWVPIKISYLTGRVTGYAGTTAAGLPLEQLIDTSLRADSPMSAKQGIRLLICGRAGSGKTTAAQWIAFSCAQERLTAGAAYKGPLVPFFVRLRETITSRKAPSDRSLLYSAQLREEVDPRWLEDAAKQITPLILLDGWDELSTERKLGAAEWVGSLSRRFPHAHIVVTSRPEGVSAFPFDGHGFKRVNVLPLQPAETGELARRWFRGLVDHLYASPDVELATVERAQTDLLRDLGTPTISKLADSPLLTSMLCCLYTTGSTRAPDKRGRLYEQVVSALLDTRDRERRADQSAWDGLDAGKKEALVGAIARTMVELDVLNLALDSPDSGPSTPSVAAIVTKTLPLIGRPLSEAPMWVTAIADRSVVVQRVSQDQVEFVHRSVQDYLAAQTYLRDGDLSGLLKRAAAGQGSLLPFACYQAGQAVADEIIRWLLSVCQATGRPDRRAGLFVLIECLAAATAVSADIRAAAERVAAEIFPPRDEDEARSLATLGNSAVSYLEHSRVPPEGRRLAIDALGRIGTTEAMSALTRYAPAANRPEGQALKSTWSRFDTAAYGKSVISQLPGDVPLVLTDQREVQAVVSMSAATEVTVSGLRVDAHRTLEKLRSMPTLRHLDIKNCAGSGPLDWTADVSSLRQLSLDRCRDVGRLGRLGPPGLWMLDLVDLDCSEIDWAQLLRPLTALRVLRLSGLSRNSEAISDYALAALRKLVTVDLGPGVRCESLAFVARNPRLSRLALASPLSDEDTGYLATCIALKHLDIVLSGKYRGDLDLSGARSLQRLAISGASPEVLRQVAQMPELSEIHIRRSLVQLADGVRFGPTTKVLKMTDCTFGTGDRLGSSRSSGDAIGALAHVEEFVWRGGSLGSLLFLWRMRSLKVLDIENAGSLDSLDGLDEVPPGCSVRLVGTRWGLDESPLDGLRKKGCRLVYEPNYDTEMLTESFWVDLGGS